MVTGKDAYPDPGKARTYQPSPFGSDHVPKVASKPSGVDDQNQVASPRIGSAPPPRPGRWKQLAPATSAVPDVGPPSISIQSQMPPAPKPPWHRRGLSQF